MLNLRALDLSIEWVNTLSNSLIYQEHLKLDCYAKYG